MALLERYHLFVHDVAAMFGYEYSDATPEWMHPFIHVILVLAPSFLVIVGTYGIIAGLLKLLRRTRLKEPRSEAIRGWTIACSARYCVTRAGNKYR